MFKKIISAVPFLGMAFFSVQTYAVGVVDLDLTSPDSRYDVKQVNSCWHKSKHCSRKDSPYYAKAYGYETAAGELNVTVSGWSYGRHGIEPDYVGNFSQETGMRSDYGLGIEASSWGSQHAIDNYRGDFDMLLLSFDQSVSLDSITAGWRGGDRRSDSDNSEVSLLAYTGESDQKVGFSGRWDSLLSQGWESGGAYAIQELNQSEDVNTDGLVSQYWLVGAYNASLSGSGFSEGNDFFKLSGVSVSVNPVPIPGSMLLFGAALMGFGAIRRKKSK